MERRKKTRYTLHEPIHSSVQTVHTVKLLDLSLDGALLESNQPMALGTVCEIKVVHDGVDFLLFGMVRNCRADEVKLKDGGREAPSYSVGLQFGERGRFAVKELLSRVHSFVRNIGSAEDARSITGKPGDVSGHAEERADDRWRPDSEVSFSIRVGRHETLEPHLLEMPEDAADVRRPWGSEPSKPERDPFDKKPSR